MANTIRKLRSEIAQTITAPQPQLPVVEEKIQVRILSSFCPGGGGLAFRRGDSPTVPAEIARKWVAAKMAVEAPRGGPVEASIAMWGFHTAAMRGFDPAWQPTVKLTTA